MKTEDFLFGGAFPVFGSRFLKYREISTYAGAQIRLRNLSKAQDRQSVTANPKPGNNRICIGCRYRFLTENLTLIDVADVNFYLLFLNVFKAICYGIRIMGKRTRVNHERIKFRPLQFVYNLSFMIRLEIRNCLNTEKKILSKIQKTKNFREFSEVL